MGLGVPNVTLFLQFSKLRRQANKQADAKNQGALFAMTQKFMPSPALTEKFVLNSLLAQKFGIIIRPDRNSHADHFPRSKQ
jgi:hypothetical protein